MQYSATIPHKSSSKLLPRALFQGDQQLPKSKSFSSKNKHGKKHFQIPLQKCHSFRYQTAESYFQPIKNIHEENLLKNGYASDMSPANYRERGRHHKREKIKSSKGPLVLKRPEEHQSSVMLQYPQPLYGNLAEGRPNGIVYADLDMPKSNSSASKKGGEPAGSPASKPPKSKSKTEYATLNFNEVGKEIDV